MALAQSTLFDAAIPTPWKVLGLNLKPFSLGHYITLRKYGNAFVADEIAGATRQDVIIGCLVCSMEFDEFQNWVAARCSCFQRAAAFLNLFTFRRGALLEFAVAWKGLRSDYETMRWGRRVGLFNLNEKAKLFAEYVAEHSVSPKYWVEHECKETGSHWAHNVFITLTGELGFSRECALNMSLREALLHFFKYAENMGSVRMMTEAELEVASG